MWLHVVRAIEALKPCLVVIENVRGLLTSPAGSPGDVEPCPWCLGDTTSQPAVRALGAVLGSLADIGFDARWCVLRASEVGAPHRRERVFLTAWPAGRDSVVQDANEQLGDDRRQPTPDGTQAGWPRTEPGGRGGVAAAHPEGIRRNEGIAEPAARKWGLDLAVGGSLLASHHTSHPLRTCAEAPPDGQFRVVSRDAHLVRAGGPQSWGSYAPAIARWERITRPAPRPTDTAGRLSPLFVEWMQGLEAGWVTATPGLGRPAQLAALGNGVVPQQAAHALRNLAPTPTACRHQRPS
ncbi:MULTISPECIES: DNA cytosine methyltransferase [unclassified Streptomyces]|uniref:DNA cytosine methyltransferase n=1 Tax=unclassified Streptomyces TaxID=2593676 RepID=UPI002E19662B|nr:MULTISPECIES: DNA cytosine methyltransferase [unclassified Streptomyces]